MNDSERKIRDCPGCSMPGGSMIGEKNSFRICRCRFCQSLFTSELPPDESSEDYDSYYTEANLSVREFIYIRVREILQSFESFRSTGRILDVGFGAGTMLAVASELGWRPHGVEVSKPAVEQARSKGFNVFHGDLAEAGFESGFFDVVIASEIIEHLPGPGETLLEVSRILRPGGLFWATTPSSQSLSYRVLGTDWSVLSPPEHLQLYSVGAIKDLLARSGFRRVSVQTNGLNPFEILQRFKSSGEGDDAKVFDRVETAYQLNDAMIKSSFRRAMKQSANIALNLFKLGDSIKIRAVK